MKKSNVIIFAVLVVISAFLLWLWYFLGFNRVDNPLDLVLSILWWVIVAAAIIAIARLEKTRRRRVRTVYVGDVATFNSERGVTPIDPTAPVQDSVAAVLEELEYDFTREDFPKPEDLEVRYFIRTDEFEPAERSESAQGATSGMGAAGASAGGAGTFAGVASTGTPAGGTGGAGAASVGGAAFAGAVGASAGAVSAGTGAPAARRPRPSKWTGEVVVAGSGQTRSFDTPEELSRILATIPQAA
ncbi:MULTISPECIES: hypothetical protein [unclassified Adlercreutzia]|uniref:hypothetical protein n=1 Tax=unclassified Adlercreutzia TaxID=2636013 RepID=UPI0013EC9400|nr:MULTISPECIES: hypothetical protein [unclassified Adlercreutzia]